LGQAFFLEMVRAEEIGVQRFPEDTKDSVERLYAEAILASFPNYGRFWESFVGQHIDDTTGALGAYPIILSEHIPERERSNLLRQYELLRMQNYSIFVHLAGAHYQAEQLQASLTLEDSNRRHFIHWEAFDVALMHLGTGLALAKAMINCAYQLIGSYYLLHRLMHHRHWKGLGRAIRRPRNDEVHYSRRLHRSNTETGAFEVLKDRYYERRQAWSQDLRLIEDDNKWIAAGDKLKTDIMGTEEMFDDVWGIMIEDLTNHMQKTNTQLLYDGIHPPPDPGAVAPAVDTVRRLRRRGEGNQQIEKAG
jgi:hypothetical protein